MTKARNAENAAATSTQAPSTPSEKSHVDREANYAEAAEQIGTKLASDPSSIKKEDGDLLHSREVRAFGASGKGGLASQAQSQAAKNMGVKKTRSSTAANPPPTPAQQSQTDRETNLQYAAQRVFGRMAADPGSVKLEDGGLLSSREQRSRGRVEKGGLTSQVQSRAAKNMGMKK